MRMRHVFLVLAIFALMSCDCVSAVFSAITQESPVTVEARKTAILTYHTSTPYGLMEVRLIRIKGGRNSIINIFRDGKDQQRCDLPEYVGRTELVREGLARGSASLKLFNVSVADEGTYRCFLGTIDYFDFCDLELKVTALGSSPRITLEGLQDGGIKAMCRSAGWYPKPTLLEIDDDGEMEIRKEENGFYSIRYSRVITENSNRTFSCRLRTPYLSQELEASVYVADGLFRKSTDVFTVLFAISLVLFLVVGATLCASWACRRHKLGLSKFPFCTTLAKSKKSRTCHQPSARIGGTDASRRAKTETLPLKAPPEDSAPSL